ncbi:DUF3653 domain-containing protein [Stenotrophomonas sp. TWI809]|uniref:DUF3653 domain-containing protein n=1 Tax=Stenotrophomonas sp. TWI809 TaxID=3136796 RepID=UPI0032092F5E
MCQYLSGPFSGWSIRGNYLVSPDGDRMTPERIAGLAWRDQTRHSDQHVSIHRASFPERIRVRGMPDDSANVVAFIRPPDQLGIGVNDRDRHTFRGQLAR